MPSIRGVFCPRRAVPEVDELSSLIDGYKRRLNSRQGADIDRKGMRVVLKKMDEMVINFDRQEPMELMHWVSVLNFIDEHFDILLGMTNPETCGIPALHVPLKKDEKFKKSREEGEGDSSAMDVDSAMQSGSMDVSKMKLQAVDARSSEEVNENISIMRSFLRMSCLILSISFNKEPYASTEVGAISAYKLIF